MSITVATIFVPFLTRELDARAAVLRRIEVGVAVGRDGDEVLVAGRRRVGNVLHGVDRAVRRAAVAAGGHVLAVLLIRSLAEVVPGERAVAVVLAADVARGGAGYVAGPARRAAGSSTGAALARAAGSCRPCRRRRSCRPDPRCRRSAMPPPVVPPCPAMPPVGKAPPEGSTPPRSRAARRKLRRRGRSHCPSRPVPIPPYRPRGYRRSPRRLRRSPLRPLRRRPPLPPVLPVVPPWRLRNAEPAVTGVSGGACGFARDSVRVVARGRTGDARDRASDADDQSHEVRCGSAFRSLHFQESRGWNRYHVGVACFEGPASYRFVSGISDGRARLAGSNLRELDIFARETESARRFSST